MVRCFFLTQVDKLINAPRIPNKYFNILIIYISNIYVKLTTDNTITAGISYKQQYDCKWDRVTLTKISLCKRAFRFL